MNNEYIPSISFIDGSTGPGGGACISQVTRTRLYLLSLGYLFEHDNKGCGFVSNGILNGQTWNGQDLNGLSFAAHITCANTSLDPVTYENWYDKHQPEYIEIWFHIERTSYWRIKCNNYQELVKSLDYVQIYPELLTKPAMEA